MSTIEAARISSQRMTSVLRERAMLHRVGSTGHGLSAVGIDRTSDFTPRTWLRQLRRHRLGARFFRHGRDRGAGVRSDGSCVRCRDQLLRHRECVRRRPQRNLHRQVAEGEGIGGPAATAAQLEGVQPGRTRTERSRALATAHPAAGRRKPRRGCRPTASTCTSFTSPIPTRRSTKRCRRSTMWCAWAR